MQQVNEVGTLPGDSQDPYAEFAKRSIEIASVLKDAGWQFDSRYGVYSFGQATVTSNRTARCPGLSPHLSFTIKAPHIATWVHIQDDLAVPVATTARKIIAAAIVEKSNGSAVLVGQQENAPGEVASDQREPRHPGAHTLVRMHSGKCDSAEAAQDVLAEISALAGFVFGYVDEKGIRTVSFHRDVMPDHVFASGSGMSRVFSVQKGRPASAAPDSVQEVLEQASADDLQNIAHHLGFQRTLQVVGEMLYASLPEEAVAVALDGLQSESERLRLAQVTSLVPSLAT